MTTKELEITINWNRVAVYNKTDVISHCFLNCIFSQTLLNVSSFTSNSYIVLINCHLVQHKYIIGPGRSCGKSANSGPWPVDRCISIIRCPSGVCKCPIWKDTYKNTENTVLWDIKHLSLFQIMFQYSQIPVLAFINLLVYLFVWKYSDEKVKCSPS